MNLKDLLEKGVQVQGGFESRTVKWEDVEFQIDVKKEMSAADYEFIYMGVGLGKQDPGERSVSARRIHRMIRLDGEQIPVATAETFKMEFIGALSEQINAVEKPPEEKN